MYDPMSLNEITHGKSSKPLRMFQCDMLLILVPLGGKCPQNRRNGCHKKADDMNGIRESFMSEI